MFFQFLFNIFIQENIVKLQVLNLAVKLFLTNPQQTDSLCRYLFSLARYDENYDIRDRARFLKPFIFPPNGETILSKQAKRIFLSAKPAPSLVSQYSREQFQLGSLAHYLNSRTHGYHDLPAFPKKAPDSSVRGVENAINDNNFEQNGNQERENPSAKGTNKSHKKDKSFYSESDNENDSSEDDSSSEGSSDENSGLESSDKESENGSKSENDSESDEESNDSSDDESSEESSSEDEDKVDDSVSSNEKYNVENKLKENSKAIVQPSLKVERSNLDLLLDLGDIAPTAPIMTPSLGGFFTPISSSRACAVSTSRFEFELVGPVHVSLDKRELLNKTNSQGLQINYRFTRAPHLFSSKMVSIELTFHNESKNDLENIHLSDKSTLPASVAICDFAPIAKLNTGQCVQGILGVDFNDSTQPLSFEIASSAGSAKVSLKPSVGELIRAVRFTETIFKEEQSRLRGMNEHTCKLDTQINTALIQRSIFETANLALIVNKTSADEDALSFAGQTMSSQSLALITVERNESKGIQLTVNCEKMVIGSMLLNEIKNSFRC